MVRTRTDRPEHLGMRTSFDAICMFCVLSFVAAEAGAQPLVHLYGMTEESMVNQTPFDNPFTDTELRLEVQAPDDRELGGVFRWYDFHHGYGIPVFNEEGVWCLNAQRTRIATLSHLFAGGYSHFATWIKEDKTTSSSWHTDWNTVTSAHKEALPALGRLNRFFNRPDIDINAGKPAHDLVSVEGDGPAMCLAAPGEQYYLWISKGGAVSLDLSDTDGTYEAVRYRGDDLPADDGGTTLGTFAGGKVADLGVTPKTGYGNDYVIVVKRIDHTHNRQ